MDKLEDDLKNCCARKKNDGCEDQWDLKLISKQKSAKKKEFMELKK